MKRRNGSSPRCRQRGVESIPTLGRRLAFAASPMLCLFAVQTTVASDASETDTKPLLLPPRGEIPPGFWEQYAWHVAAGAVLLLGVVAIAAWWWARPRSKVVAPPAQRAREALEPLLDQPETGSVLMRVSQVVRGYFGAVFGLPPGELTTGDVTRGLAASDCADPQVAAAAIQFLRACDERKFAPRPPTAPLGAAAEALRLIARAEEALAPQPAGAAAVSPAGADQPRPAEPKPDP